MKISRLIVIMALLLVFVTACTISPIQGVNKKGNSTGAPIGNDKKVPTSNKETITLNVLVPEQSLLRVGSKQLKSMIPKGVNLQFISAKQQTYIEADEIIPKLLARSKEFDIYYIQSNQEFAKSIIEKGYYVDLLQNKQLALLFDEMHPQIKKWSMYGKKAFGFPSIVVPYAHMLVNESALEEAGYSMDNLQTFADIFKFSNDWTKTHQETGVYVSMNETCPSILLSYLLPHYDYEKMFINIDNTEFRDLLKSIKALKQDHSLGDVDAVGFYNIPFENVPIYIGNVFSVYAPNSSIMGGRPPAPVPLVDNETPGKRPTDSSFYIINPYSDHIDAAMDLLIQIGAMSKLPIAKELLYKDMAAYSMKGSSDIFGSPMASIYNKKEMYVMMGQFWEQHELYFAFPGMKDILSVCDDYFKDAITLEESIGKMKKIIDIVRRENLK